MTKIQTFLAASLAALSVPAQAATSFDMEGVAPGYYPSLVLSEGATTLTVTPEGGSFIVAFDWGVALLGSVALAGTTQNPVTDFNQWSGMRFSFNQSISSITFNFGDGGGENDSPATVSAFDAADVLLGSANAPYPADFGAGSSLTLSFATARYFIVGSGAGLFNADSLGWDIGAYTVGGAVPEPASWAMMIAGFGLAGAAMRRRSVRISLV